MRIGVPKETRLRELRVAVTPTTAKQLATAGFDVVVEASAGFGAGHEDDAYREAGATIASLPEVVGEYGIIVQVNGPDESELKALPVGREHTLVGLQDSLWTPQNVAAAAKTEATVIALDLIPRITRAQNMDVLSSMATIAGYQAVLAAADLLPKMIPMMMTAAGTIPAAKVLVLGAGVAGLQAIATAKRLGASVSAYDVRPAAAEQITSVGATSIDLQIDTSRSEEAGGYAKSQTSDTAALQIERLAPYVGEADIVITTAAIPGKQSPELVTPAMVETMKPGSVIIDLAAERGGNCRLTEADLPVQHYGVKILGPTDLPSKSATSASLMFSNNANALINHLVTDQQIVLDFDDPITDATVVGFEGQIRNQQVAERLAKTTDPKRTET